MENAVTPQKETTAPEGRASWRRWLIDSPHRKVFTAAFLVAAITFGVHIANMARELVLAATFGRGDQVDAFLVAMLIPTFVTSVIAGAFSAAFIPTFIRVRDQEGSLPAQRLLSNVLLAGTALVVVTTFAVWLLASWLLPMLATGFSPSKLALTQNLFSLLIPLAIASAVIAIWSSVLNAVERFAVISVAPLAVPLASIVALLASSHILGIHSLVVGLYAGTILQVAILGGALWRQKFSLIPRWGGWDESTKTVFLQFAPVIGGALLMSGTTIVDRSMASMLSEGSVSALNYGSKVVSFILGIVTLGISTATFPYLSKIAANRQWDEMKTTVALYQKITFVFAAVVMAAIFLLSDTIVSTIFERGAFSSSDTVVVSGVQKMYAIQIPFYALSILYVRLLGSLQMNKYLVVGSGINLASNIVLNLAFIPIFGVAGIALSTSIVYLISFLFLHIVMKRCLAQVSSS